MTLRSLTVWRQKLTAEVKVAEDDTFTFLSEAIGWISVFVVIQFHLMCIQDLWNYHRLGAVSQVEREPVQNGARDRKSREGFREGC